MKRLFLLWGGVILNISLVNAQDNMKVHISDDSKINVPVCIVDSITFDNENYNKISMSNVIDGGISVNGQEYIIGGVKAVKQGGTTYTPDEQGVVTIPSGGSGGGNLYPSRGQQEDGAPTNKLLDDELLKIDKVLHGGADKEYTLGGWISGWISGTDTWVKGSSSTNGFYFVAVDGGEDITITANSYTACMYAFLKDNTCANKTTPSYCDGYTTRQLLSAGASVSLKIPSDARYVYVLSNLANTAHDTSLPVLLVINDWDVISQSYAGEGGLVNKVEEIPKLSDRVSALEDKFAVPTYWSEELDACIDAVKANQAIAKNGSFLFTTDTHFPFNAGYDIEIAKKISDSTDGLLFVNGGDILDNNHTKTEAISIIRDYARKCYANFGVKYRYAHGNHDNNPQSSTSSTNVVSDDELFMFIMRPIFTNVVVENNKFNYYWDDDANGIRYVTLNTGSNLVLNEQLDWFANLALSTPLDYKIAIFIHGMWSSATGALYTHCDYLASMCDAINTKSSYTNLYSGSTFDFATSTNKVMFIMCGHNHVDRIENYGTSQFPIIECACDKLGNGFCSTVEQRLTICSIDLSGGKLYMYRFGQKPSAWGTSRNKSINIAL